MGIEIERKFLVTEPGWRADVMGEGVHLRQGYLRRGTTSVRVRRAGPEAFLTVKGPGTRSRAEYEYPIPASDADELLDTLCEPGLIDKTRHRIEVGGRVWEVDEFHGRHDGLVLAEIELPEADAPFERPGWLGPEVTDDPSYTNAELSRPDHAGPDGA
jgi:adenylate cyclase